MDLNKVINNSLSIIFSDNENILENIIDDLMDVMPEDDRTFTDKEFNEYQQKIVDIVKNITALSVLSTMHATKSVELEEFNELKKEHSKLTERLTVLENRNSSQPDDTNPHGLN